MDCHLIFFCLTKVVVCLCVVTISERACSVFQDRHYLWPSIFVHNYSSLHIANKESSFEYSVLDSFEDFAVLPLPFVVPLVDPPSRVSRCQRGLRRRSSNGSCHSTTSSVSVSLVASSSIRTTLFLGWIWLWILFLNLSLAQQAKGFSHFV